MDQLTNEQIRLLRQSRGMGQKEVAARMENISKQRYSELENHGALQPATIEKDIKSIRLYV